MSYLKKIKSPPISPFTYILCTYLENNRQNQIWLRLKKKELTNIFYPVQQPGQEIPIYQTFEKMFSNFRKFLQDYVSSQFCLSKF